MSKCEKRDFVGAISDFTKCIAINPKCESAYFNRGIALLNKGDSRLAIDDLTVAIKYNSKNESAWGNRGIAHSAQGDLDEAISDLTQAIALNPQSARAYYNRGLVYSRKENHEQAFADFRRAIKVDPKYPYVHYAYANYLYARQNWEEALSEYRKSCEVAETLPYAKLRIWLVCARIGQREQASKELALFVRGSEKNGDWYSKLSGFLLGALPESDLLKAAETRDPLADSHQKCEAYFYAGTVRLIGGDLPGCKELFRKCLETNVKDYSEYVCAAAELKELEK